MYLTSLPVLTYQWKKSRIQVTLYFRNTNTLISSLGVVTGNNTLVRKFCEAEKLPIHEWPIEVSSITNQYDLGVVVSFGHLIPKDVIEAFPL